MKIKSLKIGKHTEAKETATYRKLGKHSYIVNETILVVFAKSEDDKYHPTLYKLSNIENGDFNLPFLNNVKDALEKKHLDSLEKDSPDQSPPL